MCGRFVSPDEAALEREFMLTPDQATLLIAQSFNVAPSQRASVILERDGKRQVHNIPWNFQPSWAKNK